MATHSSILPGESHGQKRPGRLQSIGPQRVRDDWSNWACMNIQFSKYHLFSFFIEWCWHFSKISWQYIYIYFCTLNSIPMMCMSILMPILHYLNDCSFMVSFEIEKRESSDFLFSIVLMVDLITEIDHFWDIPDFLLRNRNDSTNIAIRKNKAILCSYLVS